MLEQHCILLTKEGCVLCVTHPTQTHQPCRPVAKIFKVLLAVILGYFSEEKQEQHRQTKNNMEKFRQSIRHEFSFN